MNIIYVSAYMCLRICARKCKDNLYQIRFIPLYFYQKDKGIETSIDLGYSVTYMTTNYFSVYTHGSVCIRCNSSFIYICPVAASAFCSTSNALSLLANKIEMNLYGQPPDVESCCKYIILNRYKITYIIYLYINTRRATTRKLS